ncbi:MAG: hypothetical protein ACRDVM_02920 [Acidimicrobiia bacterium]
MLAQTFRHTAVASVDPASVWVELQEARTWAAIGGVDQIFDARHRPDGALQSYQFTTTAGGRAYQGTARAVESEAPHRMVVEVETSEIGARIAVDLAGTTGGTQVTVELSVSSRSARAAVLFPVIAGAIGSDFPGSVEGFAARLGG